MFSLLTTEMIGEIASSGGVDIPSVDTLLFVRPTESLTAMVGIAKRGESRSFFVAYFCLVKATLNDLIFVQVPQSITFLRNSSFHFDG